MTLELKTGEHRQRPTAGSAFAVLRSSPARGGSSVGQLPPKKGANIADGQRRGDWRLFSALVDVMERRVLLFSCNLAFPNCCYCCGSTEDLVDEEELSKRTVPASTSEYQRVPASPPTVRCLQRTRRSCTDPWACPRCCSGRQRSDHLQRKGGPPPCLQFPALVLNSNRSSLSFVKAVGIEPLVGCLLLSARVWNQARQCLYDRVLNCLQYRVLCSSMDVQCGDDYHLRGLYLHTLSFSLPLSLSLSLSLSLCKKGIRWSINGTGIMG